MLFKISSESISRLNRVLLLLLLSPPSPPSSIPSFSVPVHESNVGQSFRQATVALCFAQLNLTALSLVRFKAHLEDAIAQRISVYVLNRQQCFVVNGHGDEAKSATLVGLRVTDHFHALHGPERAEQLPQHILLRLGREVVHEQTPTAGTSPIGCWRRQHRTGNHVARQRREPD